MHEERVKIMTRGCNKENCQSTYINLIQSSLQAGVEHLCVIPVGFGIDGGSYKPTNVESGRDKVQIVP
jgi:hypothetical protein